MKKYYLKLKIKLILMLTLVLLLGTGFIVYQEADRIRANYLENTDYFFSRVMSFRAPGATEQDDFIQRVYDEYMYIPLSDGMGFYSMLKSLDDNRTIAEDQNFITITRCEGTSLTNDQRVILLGDDYMFVNAPTNDRISFLSGSRSTADIIGTCDDTYIYLEKLIWSDMSELATYTYIPKNKVAPPSDAIRFEEWTGGTHFDDEYPNTPLYQIDCHYVGSIYGVQEDINLSKEAKQMCHQLYEDFVSGEYTYGTKVEDGLFTCVSAGTGYLNEKYAMPYVYVFHPVSLAIEALTGMIFLVCIMWLIMIFTISSLINKVYRQQLAHETNRLNLTRGITHELKTPLAITRGYVENWEYVEEKDRKEYSKTMIDEIEHMNGMVTDLLELSRLEAKRKEPVLEQVELYALTQSVLKRMDSIISEKGLVVTDKTQQGEYLVNADLEMMRTVLANFITNAIKYADREISLCIMSSEKKVRFVIINDGKTIPWNKVDKVWDEFYIDGVPDGTAGSAGAGDRLGSSGLGLAIAKNILVLHKAKYGCESNEKTTTFWFEMKRVSEE
ncbi:MAG: HAMP domain-containing histidine kinase [Lachnospira sp.]|nr:HAMP domain-containing histidine kinase [Lachnospira sp.]